MGFESMLPFKEGVFLLRPAHSGEGEKESCTTAQLRACVIER